MGIYLLLRDGDDFTYDVSNNQNQLPDDLFPVHSVHSGLTAAAILFGELGRLGVRRAHLLVDARVRTHFLQDHLLGLEHVHGRQCPGGGRRTLQVPLGLSPVGACDRAKQNTY